MVFPFDSEIPTWHKCCAKVPQSIQLLSDSIISNVAFGEEVQEIDEDRVWDALSAAQLDEVVSELPYGIYSQIGDNGIILSESTSKIGFGESFLSAS